MQNKYSRIEKLEQAFKNEQLMLLTCDSEGNTFTETVRQMIDGGHQFKKVVGGGSPNGIHDISLILDWTAFSNGCYPAGGFLTEEFKQQAANKTEWRWKNEEQ